MFASVLPLVVAAALAVAPSFAPVDAPTPARTADPPDVATRSWIGATNQPAVPGWLPFDAPVPGPTTGGPSTTAGTSDAEGTLTTGGGVTYPSGSCPQMTDSIRRLYRAYFGRDPDETGFQFWVAQYQSGAMSLEEISQHFARSSEFTGRNLSSTAEFVEWVYTSDLGRDTDPTGRQYWIDNINGGYSRGSMILTFSESEAYVARTGTSVPLAGYTRWYPQGSHWYCNIGSQAVPVRALVGSVGADFYFKNRSAEVDQVGLWTTYEDGRRQVTMNAGELQAGYTDYDWDGNFRGDGDYGQGIDVEAGPMTDWIVVFYPNSIGSERLGWQLS
ncbi:MAG: DUF4214 domain-containing protein [Acidimicrobiales bacterium]